MKLRHITEDEYEGLEDADEFRKPTGAWPPWADQLHLIGTQYPQKIVFQWNLSDGHDYVILGNNDDLEKYHKANPKNTIFMDIHEWMDQTEIHNHPAPYFYWISNGRMSERMGLVSIYDRYMRPDRPVEDMRVYE